MIAPSPVTLLAFDYSARRIGVAVGQTITGSASPLKTVAAHGTKPDWIAISDIIDTWQPDALVVGLPLNMDGSEQSATVAARRFARQLEGRFGLTVHTVDERLTTVEARERLVAAGNAGGEDDPVAAQIILESWFNETGALA